MMRYHLCGEEPQEPTQQYATEALSGSPKMSQPRFDIFATKESSGSLDRCILYSIRAVPKSELNRRS
jgi:hypothetical protein